ncbi:hypothetical protein AHF37_01192 [Paragonimus kellicotti]|nr:hypothetical protein AHF37_01192 [Paragonimus kellicotti]
MNAVLMFPGRIFPCLPLRTARHDCDLFCPSLLAECADGNIEPSRTQKYKYIRGTFLTTSLSRREGINFEPLSGGGRRLKTTGCTKFIQTGLSHNGLQFIVQNVAVFYECDPQNCFMTGLPNNYWFRKLVETHRRNSVSTAVRLRFG